MKALSIKQPWAWLIIHGGKDIENRCWRTHYRGPFLIHASQGMTHKAYDEVNRYALERGIQIPPFDQLQRGGIIGQAEIVDCVPVSSSRWFMGPFGFVLRNAQPLPFRAGKAVLGFFTPKF